MLVPVILSGGAGSRLWPVSRESYPKPFIRLADGKTLLRKAFERAIAISGVEVVITVTNREYYFLTKDEYDGTESGVRRLFLLEPRGRNTAPAVAMAALHAVALYGEDVELLVLPADHVVEDAAAFQAAVRAARGLASSGVLVTFGIAPTRAETGYGYIECGAPTADGEGFCVKRFVEKPAAEVAAEFIASGRFLWNSGMFCFRAQAYLDALRSCAPGLHEKIAACWAATASAADPEKVQLSPEHFEKLDDVSIDYAVMEKHPDVAVVRAVFDWNDIGSWRAMGDLIDADAHGNRILGEVIAVDTRNCFVQSDSRLVATVGLENLVVVDTPDALLVMDQSRAQDVKEVVSRLKVSNHAAHDIHATMHRPWGTYTVLEEGPSHKIKRIVVKPRASISLQMHHHRSEHWVVVSGTADVVNGSATVRLRQNESTFIPAGARHRLSNAAAEDLVIIEVQTGSYLGEDDIVRFEDTYGRA